MDDAGFSRTQGVRRPMGRPALPAAQRTFVGRRPS